MLIPLVEVLTSRGRHSLRRPLDDCSCCVDCLPVVSLPCGFSSAFDHAVATCAAVLAQSSRCFEFVWDLLAGPCGDLQQPLDVVCVAPSGAPCNEYGLYRIFGTALSQSAARFVRRVRLAGLLRCCQSFNGLLQPPVCVLDVLGFRLPP